MIKSIQDKVAYINLEKNKVTLAYIDEYSDPHASVILAIHGLGNAFAVWMNNFSDLKKNYRCIAIDLPGNGLSEKSINNNYSIPFFADVINEFIQTMNLSNVNLMGHSMGGQIALYTAINYGKNINDLILIGPAGFEEFNFIEKNLMMGSAQMMDFLVSNYDKLAQALNMSFYKLSPESNKVKNILLDMLRLQDPLHYKKMLDQCVASMLNDTVLSDLKNINNKTLIIFGYQDAMIPNKMFHPISTEIFAQQAVKKMPNAELKMIKNAGHFVQLEANHEVNTLIYNFLSNSA